MGDAPERWHLVHDKHDHVVEIVQGRLVRQVSWTRDGVELASRKTTDETVVLKADGEEQAVRLKFGVLGPARRVTLHSSDTEAQTGLAGTDLEPEAGSRAAERAEWIGRHPHLHTARQTAIAAAGVGVPVLVVWLLTLVPWPDLDLPSIPLPDMPSIPWPDLPAIPWPDLPSIPWPDVDLPDLPGWVDTVRKFAIPILIAFFIARGEVKRRRRAEAERAAGKAGKVEKVEDET
ncbi:hypothetical protein [Nocardioides renjunii]|uniref:hypothetical protein n=1 Tax=Nocardioides renjunii TaxID=3095075 RepID=UPI002AFE51A2|nr:hypothetical protein [Nocardioides sp. S-34]WQQ21115.1 hypothetical protein SHK17_14545 [Nocardioides sp. S-34]